MLHFVRMSFCHATKYIYVYIYIVRLRDSSTPLIIVHTLTHDLVQSIQDFFSGYLLLDVAILVFIMTIVIYFNPLFLMHIFKKIT